MPPATLLVRIGTKVNISTIGRPRVKIQVYKQLPQQTASNEIIKIDVTSYPGAETKPVGGKNVVKTNQNGGRDLGCMVYHIVSGGYLIP